VGDVDRSREAQSPRLGNVKAKAEVTEATAAAFGPGSLRKPGGKSAIHDHFGSRWTRQFQALGLIEWLGNSLMAPSVAQA
jgi:hypothetical protein